MFDHHHLHVSKVTESVTRNVTEKRAPTDESVKLLREMEAAAQKSIILSTRVRETTFECVVHAQLDDLNEQIIFMMIYKLQAGEKRKVRYEYERSLKPRSEQREEIWIGLRDALAKDVATQLLSASLAPAMQKVMP